MAVPDAPPIVDYHDDACAIFIKLLSIERIDEHSQSSLEMPLVERVYVMSDVCCLVDDLCEEMGIERIKTICCVS